MYLKEAKGAKVYHSFKVFPDVVQRAAVCMFQVSL
eukprot:CAMPEP_0204341564 /NCGR_PEP_ID=MMETSP0469-20131031/23468_1 /ASSEMBLY_ACC=CAM_ASM_000384 /TAXON_ID=2969 /ORGANISM="Oxyrrhis marina" /LENGTH=34 /DNA_ID= /DNA_START= /DNA_END= /DNA_ORIENTATION=